MKESRTVLQPNEAAQATLLGHFVAVAYDMFASITPANPNPLTHLSLPLGFKLHGVIWMEENGKMTLYGLVALSSDRKDAVLAIRGIQNVQEWLNVTSAVFLEAWAGFGKVGKNFADLYKTLKVIPPDQRPISTEQLTSFSQQIDESIPGDASITVVGHSLGAALATLYVAENVQQGKRNIPLLCTFASPRVGNAEFAGSFDQLPGLVSWRVVNDLDAVPKVPDWGFEHVRNLYEYNSAFSTVPALDCWHALDTYMHLLDKNHPISKQCRSTAYTMSSEGDIERAATNA